MLSNEYPDVRVSVIFPVVLQKFVLAKLAPSSIRVKPLNKRRYQCHICICQFLPFKLVVALALGFAIFAQLKVKWCQANGEDRTKPD